MTQSRSTRVRRLVWDAAIFAPCYIALDWASYIDPVGPFNITPWNPQPALAIVWMMLGGFHHVPAVFCTILLADVVVRQAPGGYALTLMTALVLTFGYAAIALSLRRLVKDTGLRTVRDLTLFSAGAVLGSALVGIIFVGILSAAGQLGTLPFLNAWLRFWIGDAVGILVTGPLLLASADLARRHMLVAMLRRPEAILQAVVLAAVVWLIFKGLRGDPAGHFYLLFLPLIWIGVRSGMNGAIVATAIVQVGVVLGIHLVDMTLSIVEFQALVAALTLTGLFLGVMVDERERAEESLRQSLRLAAAGEMAGAIAHEVNQPLTALANYGRSAQMLIGQTPGSGQLLEVMAKILNEAERASEIVRRLRDFFRTGATRLEQVEVASLLAAARLTGEAAIGTLPITLEFDAAPGLPPLLADRLQIELVLRNLIANAVESIVAARRGQGHIRVSARGQGEDQLLIVIEDNGEGIAASAREGLFEPFVSGKSTGMGLGLAVSRAIAEAHGGTLEASDAGRGEFRLMLPCLRPT